MTFDSQWEDHEDDLQGDTPLDELQDFYPHVHIIDLYEGTDEWESLEEEAIEDSRLFNQNKKDKRARRNADL